MEKQKCLKRHFLQLMLNFEKHLLVLKYYSAAGSDGPQVMGVGFILLLDLA